ncbi:MAG: hypothetical protein A2499_04865 [Stygiobacter sp. RIFOXYC12_FULL_38_8]|nr:MAG: hypothetical protein A2299_16235 [Stygiobacter sp. RIFOXYB2_FULL_37_11]OGV13456.1 MAG: hypothetical protein A2237_16930 [Stygiobacter sp. RIFOXYA2_FULL_38_8]OGV14747.1 MAG: hypothetical protein A2440_09615 [Stygiobacter sp. RIFOXYC2_FULL_38_25]OGV22283.1 MAG: hypothetical protein A2499_04865 [Stygiobacter sp. RIFOXYC12_FULL_38_8]OGV79240.1 MAG: hypothetical protein A2X65_01985 [Stygiobacter sp. GWF2_38_21]
MRKNILCAVFLACLLIGCTAPRLAVDHKKITDKIELKITFDESVDKETIKAITERVDGFIKDFNVGKHLFRVFLNNGAKDHYMSISIKNLEYVSVGKQVLSTFVTLLGPTATIYTLSKPELGFTIIWWWFPRYSLTVDSFLSYDIDLNTRQSSAYPPMGVVFDNVSFPFVINDQISGFHWFRSIDSQRNSLADLFYDHLFETFENLELLSN